MKQRPAGNIALVTEMMTFSKYGPVAELFIVNAIQRVAEATAATPVDEFTEQMKESIAFINARTWHATAVDIKRQLDEFYGPTDAPASTAPAAPELDRDTLVMYGAFIMEGIRDAGHYGEMLDHWNNGAVELVSQACAYAEPIARLERAAEAFLVENGHDDGFPGVFDYEVVSAFGSWIGRYVREEGNMPPREQAMTWLANEAAEFFVKVGLSEVDTHALRDLLHTEAHAILQE